MSNQAATQQQNAKLTRAAGSGGAWRPGAVGSRREFCRSVAVGACQPPSCTRNCASAQNSFAVVLVHAHLHAALDRGVAPGHIAKMQLRKPCSTTSKSTPERLWKLRLVNSKTLVLTVEANLAHVAVGKPVYSCSWNERHFLNLYHSSSQEKHSESRNFAVLFSNFVYHGVLALAT
jgi:hypothetical protein